MPFRGILKYEELEREGEKEIEEMRERVGGRGRLGPKRGEREGEGGRGREAEKKGLEFGEREREWETYLTREPLIIVVKPGMEGFNL